MKGRQIEENLKLNFREYNGRRYPDCEVYWENEDSKEYELLQHDPADAGTCSSCQWQFQTYQSKHQSKRDSDSNIQLCEPERFRTIGDTGRSWMYPHNHNLNFWSTLYTYSYIPKTNNDEEKTIYHKVIPDLMLFFPESEYALRIEIKATVNGNILAKYSDMEQYRQSMYTILADQDIIDGEEVQNGKYALVRSSCIYQLFENRVYDKRHKDFVEMKKLKNNYPSDKNGCKQKVYNFFISTEDFNLDWVSQTELFDQLMQEAELYRKFPSLLKTSSEPYVYTCAWIRRKGLHAWQHGIEVNPIVKVGDTELDQMRRGEQYDDIVEYDNDAICGL